MSDDQMTPEGEHIKPAGGEDQAATATEQAGETTPAETDIAPDPKVEAPEESAAPESVTEVPQQTADPQTSAAGATEQPAAEEPEPASSEPLEVAAPEAPATPREAEEAPAPVAPAAHEAMAAPRESEAPVAPGPSMAPAADAAQSMDDQAEFEAALNAFEGESTGTSYDDVFRPLTRGELITARVIQVDEKRVFVDLGTKAEGIVPIEELSIGSIDSAHDIVKAGDEITVVVLNPQGRDGHPIVSRKRAEFESTWDRIVQEFENKETVSALVTERVKGGLVVDLGVRGFVPATHVGTGQIRNLDRFVGQSLPFKIIEVDRERRKVVLSNRLAEEEQREAKKKELFEHVKPGDVLDGTVRRLVDYGAFVDLGGVDGLLHVSEMSWSRVDHPKEVIKEGEELRVMVLRLDASSGRISLGRRQVLPDPWTGIKDNYKIGQTLTLPISRLVQSGAFVKLPEGAEAFIPISEMAHRRINKPSEVVSAGQEVELKVLDLRPDERRMVLSLRALQPFEERQNTGGGRDEIRSRGERRRDRGQPAAGPGNLTIGDRLGALKGLVGTFGDEDGAADAERGPKPKKTKAKKSESADEELAADAEASMPVEEVEEPAVEPDTMAPVDHTEELAPDAPSEPVEAIEPAEAVQEAEEAKSE